MTKEASGYEDSALIAGFFIGIIIMLGIWIVFDNVALTRLKTED